MNKFVGSWKLVSVEDHLDDGQIAYPYGPRPLGLLIYDASGNMAVQIMQRDRQALSSNNWQKIASKEIKTALEGFTAFFGKYEVDEDNKIVTHRVEGHLFPNSVGKELKRAYEFSGNRLILRPSESRIIVWKRV